MKFLIIPIVSAFIGLFFVWLAFATPIAQDKAVADIGQEERPAPLVFTTTIGSEPNRCASTTTISILPNSPVYYCFSFQNRGDISLSLTLLALPFLDLQLPLSQTLVPGQMISITHPLSDTTRFVHTSTMTSIATYVISNDLTISTTALFSVTLLDQQIYIPIIQRPSVSELQRSIWNRQNILDYVYTSTLRCFCFPQPAAVVHVEAGEVIAAADLETREPFTDSNTIRRFPSIDGLFNILQDAEASNAHRVIVEYHPQLGYPLSLYIDYYEFLADEEIRYYAEGLTIIE